MDTIINMNVGGKIYTTSRTTLTRYPASMLGRMFGGDLPSTRDLHGNYVIDRDGKLFRHILMFLRSSRLILPENFQEIDMLAEEAEFYQIPELICAVKIYKDQQLMSAPSPDVCTLNISGTIYTVLGKYLIKKEDYKIPVVMDLYDYELILQKRKPYEQLTLGSIWETISKPTALEDKQGNYVVDLDPSLFRYILNFVRTSRFNLPPDFAEFKELQAEINLIEMGIDLKQFLYFQISKEEQNWVYLDQLEDWELADEIESGLKIQKRWPHAGLLWEST